MDFFFNFGPLTKFILKISQKKKQCRWPLNIKHFITQPKKELKQLKNPLPQTPNVSLKKVFYYANMILNIKTLTLNRKTKSLEKKIKYNAKKRIIINETKCLNRKIHKHPFPVC